MSSASISSSAKNLFIQGTPTIGHVVTCTDHSGRAQWKAPSGGGSTPGAPGAANVYEWSIYLVDNTEVPYNTTPPITTFNQALVAQNYLKDTYTTIQAAIDAAEADYAATPLVDIKRVVLIRPGTYVENLTLSTSRVDLLGAIGSVNSSITITGNVSLGGNAVTVFTNVYINGNITMTTIAQTLKLTDSRVTGTAITIKDQCSLIINGCSIDVSDSIKGMGPVASGVPTTYQVEIENSSVVGNIVLGDLGNIAVGSDVILRANNCQFSNTAVTVNSGNSVASSVGVAVTFVACTFKDQCSFEHDNKGSDMPLNLNIDSCAYNAESIGTLSITETGSIATTGLISVQNSSFSVNGTDFEMNLALTQLIVANCNFYGFLTGKFRLINGSGAPSVKFQNVGIMQFESVFFQTN